MVEGCQRKVVVGSRKLPLKTKSYFTSLFIFYFYFFIKSILHLINTYALQRIKITRYTRTHDFISFFYPLSECLFVCCSSYLYRMRCMPAKSQTADVCEGAYVGLTIQLRMFVWCQIVLNLQHTSYRERSVFIWLWEEAWGPKKWQLGKLYEPLLYANNFRFNKIYMSIRLQKTGIVIGQILFIPSHQKREFYIEFVLVYKQNIHTFMCTRMYVKEGFLDNNGGLIDILIAVNPRNRMTFSWRSFYQSNRPTIIQ